MRNLWVNDSLISVLCLEVSFYWFLELLCVHSKICPGKCSMVYSCLNAPTIWFGASLLDVPIFDASCGPKTVFASSSTFWVLGPKLVVALFPSQSSELVQNMIWQINEQLHLSHGSKAAVFTGNIYDLLKKPKLPTEFLWFGIFEDTSRFQSWWKIKTLFRQSQIWKKYCQPSRCYSFFRFVKYSPKSSSTAFPTKWNDTLTILRSHCR